MKPILSILTPSVPSRIADFGDIYNAYPGPLLKLIEKLEDQIGSLPVEHLIFTDNKRRTIGEKRDALLRIARGRYVAFVDDDDDVSDDYVQSLLAAAQSDPDVITFEQDATVNGQKSRVIFNLGSENTPFATGGITRRNAWHVCAWRRSLAVCSHFPVSDYGEDWEYAARLCALPNLREVHIPKVLHYYRHSAETTEAPPPI